MRLILFGPLSAPHTNNWAGLLDTDSSTSVEIITLHDGTSTHKVTSFDLPVGKLRFLCAIPVMICLRTFFGQSKELMAHYLSSYGLVALLTGWRPVIVCWGSDVNVLTGKFPTFAKLVALIINRRARALIAPTEAIAKKLIGMGVNQKLIHTFQYGIKRERLLPAYKLRQKNPGGEAFRFASIRNGAPIYQIEKICDAFIQSTAYSRGAELVIFGAGHSKLVQLYSRQHQQIIISDGLEGESFYNALALCDVAISIPVRDGLSLGVLEALGLGLDVLLSREGSYETILPTSGSRYVESSASSSDLAIEIDSAFLSLSSSSSKTRSNDSLVLHNFICTNFDSEVATQKALKLFPSYIDKSVYDA